MRAQDLALLRPHCRSRRRAAMVPAAQVQRAVHGEKAQLVGGGVLR